MQNAQECEEKHPHSQAKEIVKRVLKVKACIHVVFDPSDKSVALYSLVPSGTKPFLEQIRYPVCSISSSCAPRFTALYVYRELGKEAFYLDFQNDKWVIGCIHNDTFPPEFPTVKMPLSDKQIQWIHELIDATQRYRKAVESAQNDLDQVAKQCHLQPFEELTEAEMDEMERQ